MRKRLITAFGAAMLLAAGCGGGGDDRLSAEEFTQRANAICDKYDEQIDALEEPSTLDEVSPYVDEAVPIIETGLGELRALEPPEELADDYDAMLAEADRILAAARDLRDAAEEGDAAEVQRLLREGNAADEESNRLARKIGLTGCA